MSSTNRGSVRKEHDFYATPESAFKPLLPHLDKSVSWWEPAAGDHRLIGWMSEAGFACAGRDLNDGYDFLKDETYRAGIITNPPFSLALEFCSHALKYSDDVVMLLRLNFLGSQDRHEWWTKNEPTAIYVLSERPDFTGGGGDSTEYCWMVWGGDFSGIRHLAPWQGGKGARKKAKRYDFS